MKITITIDTDLVRVVTLIPTQKMIDVAWSAMPDMPFDDMRKIEYAAVLSAVPDTLPGVVAHSGEPCGWRMHKDGEDIGCTTYDKDYVTTLQSNGYMLVSELFTHPPEQPVVQIPSDVQAALNRMCTPLHESALKGATAECDSRSMAIIKRYIESTAAPAQPDTEALQARSEADQIEIETLRYGSSIYCRRIAELEAQLAAQARQELEGKSSGYITTVPDKADRIVWRNNYYHLPIKNAPAQAGQVIGEGWGVRHLSGQWVNTLGNASLLSEQQAKNICVSPDYVATKLYICTDPPAPVNATAIVQAALEAAAVIAESFCACDSGIEQDAVNFAAKNKSRRIRALNPKSILDEMSK